LEHLKHLVLIWMNEAEFSQLLTVATGRTSVSRTPSVTMIPISGGLLRLTPSDWQEDSTFISMRLIPSCGLTRGGGRVFPRTVLLEETEKEECGDFWSVFLVKTECCGRDTCAIQMANQFRTH